MKSILLSLLLALNVTASDIQVFFSPNGGCAEAVVQNLNKATMRINFKAVLKREAFFLKTGKLSQRRNLLKPVRWRHPKPTLATESKPQLTETSVKTKEAPPNLVASQ